MSCSYYVTQTHILDDKNLHIPCEIVDNQISEWLSGITNETALIPVIREIYHTQIKQASKIP